MTEETEPDTCQLCAEDEEYCRCYVATLTPWHVWVVTDEGVGSEPIATFATRANAYAWANKNWTPDQPNDAAWVIARTYRYAVKVSDTLY